MILAHTEDGDPNAHEGGHDPRQGASWPSRDSRIGWG
jgi:hypothetical protein